MDVRGYLAELARQSPGSLERFPPAADWQRQPEADANELAKQERRPVLWWDAPGGIPAGIVANLFAERSRMAAWFGVEPVKLGLELCRRLQDRTLSCRRVEPSQAPVRQVVQQGANVALGALTIPRHGGALTTITSGLLIYRDPIDGNERICQHRALLTSASTLALPLDHHSRFRRAAEAAVRSGERIQAALWIGHHPALLLAASCLGNRADVWAHLSSVVQEEVGVTPTVSFGDRLAVPADAEVILEGEIDPAESEHVEGFPAGNGYLARATSALRLQVGCISRRADALWCDVVPEQTDAYHLAGVALETALLEEVGRRAPSLLNVHVPPTGVGGLHGYLQLRNPRKGEAREAILSALAMDARLKHVFAVDDDINIFDDREVLWALATRSQWERDAIVLPGLRGTQLDPLADGASATKGAFDCTRPADEVYSERNAVSPSVYAEVRIEDYLDAAHLARIPIERQ